MAQENLWNHLQSIIPQNITPIVREAIDAVGSLPGLRRWKPSFENWYAALKIVEWGLPLVLIIELSDEDTNLKPLRQKISSAIANKGTPRPSDLAELDIAALMALNKARSLKYVKTSSARTPDFQMQWDDTLVEFEVTKALPRETHIELDIFAMELLQKIIALKLPWRIIIYVATKLSEADILLLLQTLQEVQPGGYKELSGKWWLIVESPPAPVRAEEFNMTIGSKVGQHFIEGWPTGTALSGAQLGVRIYNPEEGMISVNIIDVVPGVPIVNYINPLDRKATRIQGSKTFPFIVAIDIGDLPGGYVEYERLLPIYLKAYPSISAVLLFQREAQAGKFGWTWILHLNPDAEYQLPSAMLEVFPKQGSQFWAYIDRNDLTLDGIHMSVHS